VTIALVNMTMQLHVSSRISTTSTSGYRLS
jgi:hypothetical protein